MTAAADRWKIHGGILPQLAEFCTLGHKGFCFKAQTASQAQQLTLFCSVPHLEGCSVGSGKHANSIWIQGTILKIALQSAITNAGKHSITVYTAHNNILWSEAQHWEQESLRFRAILQYKHAKHYNPSGPEQQHLEIMASSQTTALNPSSTKGMPSCHALHTLCAIT